MIDLEEFAALKRQAEEAGRDRDRADGARIEALKRLRELGAKDLEEADRLLATRRQKLSRLEAEWERLKAAFDERWGGKLEDGE